MSGSGDMHNLPYVKYTNELTWQRVFKKIATNNVFLTKSKSKTTKVTKLNIKIIARAGH